jgi:OOP family OmpA-OmpF porin
LYLRNYKIKIITPEIKKLAEPFKIDEVFLITKSGLLIRRVSRKVYNDMDDDILSSMLTAVGEFVKDSFGSQNEEGELDELQYGKMRIVIEYGRDLYLAVLVKGQESPHLRLEMKRVLKIVHRKYGRAFDSWDGDLDKFRGSEPILQTLLRMS